MSNEFWLQLQKQINKRKEREQERSLLKFKTGVDFVSNDYLGLSKNHKIKKCIAEAYFSNSVYTGSTGSRLISGNYDEIERLEYELAQFFQSESALFFISGYHANTGLLQAIGGRDFTLLLDEQSHVSLKEGARLSLAKKLTFKHNDTKHLEKRLSATPKGKAIIVTESIFSMEGDLAPLHELCELRDKYEATLVLDEAHATGVLGDKGKGLASELDLLEKVDIRIHTFGKAWGHAGATVVGSNLLKKYLLNFALPFIYTTAPPPLMALTLLHIKSYLEENDYERKSLFEIINTWNLICRSNRGKSKFTFSENLKSPIQYIKAERISLLHQLTEELNKNQFLVKTIMPPTVAPGLERIRVSLHSYNTSDQIRQLIEITNSVN